MNKAFSPNLKPLLGGPASDLLRSPQLIHDWVRGFGSPLHLMFPERAQQNYATWKESVTQVYANTHIQFALKSCKSTSLLRAMAELGAGADVSSTPEMLSAFANLVPPVRMAMTGPAKTTEDIELALAQGIALHVDCVEELKRILVLSRRYGPSLNGALFLRLKPLSEPTSRFGMTVAQIKICLLLMAEFGLHQFGLSFHVNDYELDHRITELVRCLQMAQEFTAEGFDCSAIDIGGGFPMRYLSQYSARDFANGVHWQGRAKSGGYPYDAALSGADFAAEVLRQALNDPLLRAFAETTKLKIMMQPGRALVDKCGLTVLRVTDTKAFAEREQIAVLEGMSFSLSETWFGSDFVPEPLVIENTESSVRPRAVQTFLAGRSCLEADMLRHRAIFPEKGICSGDLVIFANTAGYQMDSNESSFHQLPLPKKMAVSRDEERWLVRAE